MSTRLVYQFKITLAEIDPAVWRRIQVPAAYSFWDLHVAIQDAMGWQDYHLHEFRILNPKRKQVEAIGIPDDDAFIGDEKVLPGWKLRIAKYFSAENPQCSYTYDFGDDWRHSVVLEEILPRVKRARYPGCSDGARACPPEDCGGIPGYEDLLRAARRKGAKGLFDAAHFDPGEVEFDDPEDRWFYSFQDAVILKNDTTLKLSSPPKPDRSGRFSFDLPVRLHDLVQRHCPLDADLHARLSAAPVASETIRIKLSLEELHVFIGRLVLAVKRVRPRFDRVVLQSLCEHFSWLASWIRERR